MKQQENNSEFFSIYHIGVYKTFLESLSIDDLIKKCYKFKENYPISVYKSNKGGFQTEGNLNKHPDFYELTQNLNNLFFKTIKDPNQHITSMWINISSYNHNNDIHAHGSDINKFSGVLYLQVPKNSGSITFRNPLAIDACFEYFPSPKEVLLFPCSLPHQVNSNLSNEDRISIAFNYE